MGKTKAMIYYEKFEREKELKKERCSCVEVLTGETKKKAGLNYKFTWVWEGGTAGLKIKRVRK